MANTYSKQRDGDKLLSPNFKVKEFACKDGTDTVLVDDKLTIVVQAIRAHFGKPVTVNSGYRTPAYNKQVGGASASQHLLGTAADLSVSGVSPLEVARFAQSLMISGGIGLYDTFTHVDVRAAKSRWKNNKETGNKETSVSGF